MTEKIDIEVVDLIATLTQANADELAYTTNALLDGYRRAAAEAQIELELIRKVVENLFYGPYQPSQSAVLDALYPNYQVVEELAKQRLER